MQDDLEDHPKYYCSLTYEYWCDLLSTIEVKDERNISSAQIKKFASARADSISDSDKSVSIPRKKKASTGVLRSKKNQKKAHKHHGIQRYCVLCKKAVIPDQKCMSHSAEDFTVLCTNRTIKDGIIIYVVSKANTVKQYKKSEKNGRKT